MVERQVVATRRGVGDLQGFGVVRCVIDGLMQLPSPALLTPFKSALVGDEVFHRREKIVSETSLAGIWIRQPALRKQVREEAVRQFTGIVLFVPGRTEKAKDN